MNKHAGRKQRTEDFELRTIKNNPRKALPLRGLFFMPFSFKILLVQAYALGKAGARFIPG